jgi:arylformamidase
MNLYRGMERAALDAAYNNSAAVRNSAAILADWEVRSAAVARAYPQHLDLRYGPDERNRIDFIPGRAGAPVLVFIHGGYWQMRAKETFRFLAAGPLAHGVNVALVAYTLAPAKPLRGIIDEIRVALGWLRQHAAQYGGDPQALVLSGWSAGGHLAASCLSERGVCGGIAISGIYDLEPIRLSFLNDKLGLDEAEALRLSPHHRLPAAAPPLHVAFGTAELPELQRQSREYAAARQSLGLPGRLVPLPGLNHFTILEELASPTGCLTALVRELARQ